jgi:hypothetical protein
LTSSPRLDNKRSLDKDKRSPQGGSRSMAPSSRATGASSRGAGLGGAGGRKRMDTKGDDDDDGLQFAISLDNSDDTLLDDGDAFNSLVF